MHGRVYLDTPGYIVVEMPRMKVKFLVSRQLTEIKNVIDYADGCLLFDTNYGEESADLNTILGEVGLAPAAEKLQFTVERGAVNA